MLHINIPHTHLTCTYQLVQTKLMLQTKCEIEYKAAEVGQKKEPIYEISSESYMLCNVVKQSRRH